MVVMDCRSFESKASDSGVAPTSFPIVNAFRDALDSGDLLFFSCCAWPHRKRCVMMISQSMSGDVYASNATMVAEMKGSRTRAFSTHSTERGLSK